MFPAAAAVIPTHSSDFLSSGSSLEDYFGCLCPVASTSISTLQQQPQHNVKKKRSLPGHPDPDAEVIALSPNSLLATNRFVCEVCSKCFQREQNLQLHRRGHNLPWKLKRRSSGVEAKKLVYVCPEPTCIHHDPSRALGDLTGIKKHFCRKHGEKKWKCHKCSKLYAVHSDWKAHSKTCGTRHYVCDCGTNFSRKDSFLTHKAFCDALAEESARLSATAADGSRGPLDLLSSPPTNPSAFSFTNQSYLSSWDPRQNPNPNTNTLSCELLEAHHYFSTLYHEYSKAAVTECVSPHLSTSAPFHKTAGRSE